MGWSCQLTDLKESRITVLLSNRVYNAFNQKCFKEHVKMSEAIRELIEGTLPASAWHKESPVSSLQTILDKPVLALPVIKKFTPEDDKILEQIRPKGSK